MTHACCIAHYCEASPCICIFQITVLISVDPLLIWWVDDRVFQRPHRAVTFDLLLSLMAAELIFSPKILPDFNILNVWSRWWFCHGQWSEACPYWAPLRGQTSSSMKLYTMLSFMSPICVFMLMKKWLHTLKMSVSTVRQAWSIR